MILIGGRMIHTIYILSPQGSIIFDKHYQGISNRNLCDLFWKEYLEHKEKGGAPPVVKIGKHYVFHVERHKLFFLATAVDETSPLLVLEFLHRMVDLFEEYFTHINENNLKDNFVTVYQLLEEMMDGGFPFTTEPAILKDMIMLPTIVNRTVSALTGSSKVAETAPDGAFSNIPWRKSNIKYSNNEIYFDVVEEVDAIFDTNGTPVSSEINGEIICNCRLGGMPDIALSFANPDLLDDCSFHPCVRYSRFQQEKIVSFIPPDGQFKLLGYKAKSTEVKVPIYVKPTVSFSGTSGHIQIVVGSRLVGNPKPAEGVTVTIPLPKNTVNHSLVPTIGRIQFDEATKVLVWDIGRMPKDRLPNLSGNVNFQASSDNHTIQPDLLIDFKVVSHITSGIQVSHVAITNEKYRPYKGVRYLTKAGKFQYRT